VYLEVIPVVPKGPPFDAILNSKSFNGFGNVIEG
jgi:hypothetical protein